MIDETQLLEQLKSDTTKNEAFKALLELYKERLYWHIRNIVSLTMMQMMYFKIHLLKFLKT